MFFKSLRRRSASSKNSINQPSMPLQLQKTVSSENHTLGKDAHKGPKEMVISMSTEESRDYEEFLAKARREEEREEERKKEALKDAIKDADRRRRNAGMDPWSRRL